MLEADRFLRRMARMLVGALVQVGLGRLQPAELGAILRRRERGTADVVTAPAAGLMLDHVFYDEEPQALREGSRALAAARLPDWPAVPEDG